MRQFWMGVIGACVLAAVVIVGVREVRNRNLPKASLQETQEIKNEF